MKINKIIYLSLATLGLLTGCKSEDPFYYETHEGMGRLLTSDLELQVKAEQITTRATQVPDANEFTVAICTKESDSEPYITYKYSELPEIVELPVGEYIIKAFYGDDSVVAAFDSPAYMGETDVLKIENGKVCSLSDPLVCTLYNVRVSVTFDDELKKAMGDDVKVAVKVGESGLLDFTTHTTTDGFFKYDEESTTLVATFTGTVNETKITEIKNFDGVKRGTYYRVKFQLRNVEVGGDEPGIDEPGGEEPGKDPSNPTDPNDPTDPTDPENPGQEEPGSATGKIVVDATVTFHDNSSNGGQNVNPDMEMYLEDERFPNSGNQPAPEEPGDDNPGEDEPGIDTPPTIEKSLPIMVSDDVDVNTRTDISNWAEGQSLAVNILTKTVLKKFKCTIDSSTLTSEALEDVGLKSELDLINDTDLFEVLGELGFPVGEAITNPQTKDDEGNYVIVFDITQFVPMLNALGTGDHDFIFDLENEDGESVLTLKLKSVEQ